MGQKYPESEKLSAAHDRITTIMEFIEWANGKGLVFGKWEGHSLNPVQLNLEDLAAEHCGVDMTVVDAERREMLAALAAPKVAMISGRFENLAPEQQEQARAQWDDATPGDGYLYKNHDGVSVKGDGQIYTRSYVA